jgi:hypothetical protein
VRYGELMLRRSSRDDLNETAFAIAQQVTGAAKVQTEKNPAAVALGRLGGLKGGKARAASLSKLERAKIARKAARTRWRKEIH